MSIAFEPSELDVVEARIERWLADQLDSNSALVAVDRGEPGQRRWYARMRGDDKDFTTIWLTLGQRTLAFETYVMPAPEENHREFFEHLLRRNAKLVGLHFSIGDEDAVFLVGSLPLTAFSEAELDRVVGSVSATVELCFRAALRIGFASRLA
jgi:hypothetical protein